MEAMKTLQWVTIGLLAWAAVALLEPVDGEGAEAGGTHSFGVNLSDIESNKVDSSGNGDRFPGRKDARYWPSGEEWETVSPAEAGMDAKQLDAALAFAGKRHSNGVVVLRGGRIVAERYWNGWDAESRSDICSVQKSITSVLLGMAIDDGLIKGLDQSAAKFLQEWDGTPKEGITVGHLVTMSSGLHSSKKSDLFDALRARDQTAYALALDQDHEPGVVWAYNNPAYGLLLTVMERATGKSRQAFAEEKLFGPLGMSRSECGWNTLSRRLRLRHHAITSSCRDTARFGLFILRGGVWRGRRLVSEDYLDASLEPQERNGAYGYLWWLNGSRTFSLPYEAKPRKGMIFPDCPPDTIAAMGAKDSKIYIIPSLDLVVTRLGENVTEDRGPGRLNAALSEFDNQFLGMISKAVSQDRPTKTVPKHRPIGSRAEQKGFQPGLTIVDLAYTRPDGNKETVTAAIWYPTEEKPRPYTYYGNRAEGKVESRVALDASLATEGTPYPLVLFAHGAFGTGYNVAYLGEYLARHGYVVVAPDYVDTVPPDYTQQIAFNRIRAGNAGSALRVLRHAGQFVREMARDREFFLSYLAEHRFRHTSFVIDEMTRMHGTKGSIFYKAIDEEAIGICGHSEGGLTVLGKIGAHPDEQFEDDRIRAAIAFSAPGYPFEESAGGIDIPVMFMVGDRDTPALHPELPRRILYDEAPSPKYYLVFRDATHFAFGNKGCGRTPLCEAVEEIPQTTAIVHYGLAFFERYLRGNASVGVQLKKPDPALAYYAKEETEGEAVEWGKEPAPQGVLGGIREEMRKSIREGISATRGRTAGGMGASRTGEGRENGEHPPRRELLIKLGQLRKQLQEASERQDREQVRRSLKEMREIANELRER